MLNQFVLSLWVADLDLTVAEPLPGPRQRLEAHIELSAETISNFRVLSLQTYGTTTSYGFVPSCRTIVSRGVSLANFS